MTPLLTVQLRKLHAASTDEGDRALLEGLLRADEATRIETPAAEKNCAVCEDPCDERLLDDLRRCPDCKLVLMHDHFHRRRVERWPVMEGWMI
jgi:hypothetical protein